MELKTTFPEVAQAVGHFLDFGKTASHFPCVWETNQNENLKGEARCVRTGSVPIPNRRKLSMRNFKTQMVLQRTHPIPEFEVVEELSILGLVVFW